MKAEIDIDTTPRNNASGWLGLVGGEDDDSEKPKNIFTYKKILSAVPLVQVDADADADI